MKKRISWSDVEASVPGGLASIPMMVTTIQSMVGSVLPSAKLPASWLESIREVVAKREPVTFAVGLPARGLHVDVEISDAPEGSQ